MVSHNLDIINIFMNQMKFCSFVEQFGQNKNNQIGLSDECKKGIEDLYYSYYMG